MHKHNSTRKLTVMKTIGLLTLVLVGCAVPTDPWVNDGDPERAHLRPFSHDGPFFGSPYLTPLPAGVVAVYLGEAAEVVPAGNQIEFRWRHAGATQVAWAEMAIGIGTPPQGGSKITVIGTVDTTAALGSTVGDVVVPVTVADGFWIDRGTGIWAIMASADAPMVMTSNVDPIGRGTVATYRPGGDWRPSDHLGEAQAFAADGNTRPPVVWMRAWGSEAL